MEPDPLLIIVRGGIRAWSKEWDLGSHLAGVQGFKSLPPHKKIYFGAYLSQTGILFLKLLQILVPVDLA